jgi:ABC-2 type transport system ATP-binding protein
MAIIPELLILDDPTLGLDTVARRQFLELAIELIQKNGRTILFSSHILSDVERIADRIGILTGGKLVVDCELEELKRRIRKWRILFEGEPPIDLPIRDIVRLERGERELMLTIADWNERKQAMIESLKPSEMIEVPMSLEDLFIECTGGTRAPGDFARDEQPEIKNEETLTK